MIIDCSRLSPNALAHEFSFTNHFVRTISRIIYATVAALVRAP